MNRLLLLLLLIMVSNMLSAQTQPVRGTVLDDSTGLPLPGVTLLVHGTTNGAQTDADGKFSLTVPADGKKRQLIVSSLGYANQEVSITANAQPIIIRLRKNVSQMDDVVVIGYGTARKRDITGSIASLSGKDIEKIPVSSAAEALTGRLPGVMVTPVDGAPGAEIVIRVRGGGSVTQDNSPLYIVDGFQVSNINDIAPADIASFDVLKDASTAAIYGARGANGVVIITTKSARGGKTIVSYNGFEQIRTFPRKLKVLSPYEFVLANYEYARLRSQTDVDNFTKYFGVYDDLELYKSQEGTDWQDKLFGHPALSQQHNVSVTGGTDKTKMSLSFTNNKDEGLMVGSGYQRNYLNFKLTHEVWKNLKLDLNSRYTQTVTDGAGTSGGSSLRVSDGITTRPVNGIADQIELDPGSADVGDDYDQFLKSLINPIDLAAQDYRKKSEKIFSMNAGLSWTVLKGLTLRSELSVSYGWTQQKRYYGPLTGESKNVGGNLPLGEITNAEARTSRFANTINYLFKKGQDHDFNILLGQEMLDGEGFSEFNRSKYFAVNMTPEKLFANMALGTFDRHATTVLPGDKLFSFFGRAIYTYKNKYTLNLTARADGSSKFAPGNRWGVFPAGSVAWQISQEDFMKNVTFVTDLKLRVSYGQAGNNRIGNDLWRRTYQISDNRTYGFGDVSNPYYVAASTTLVNPDLKWETTTTRNLGLDFTLFGNRVNGSLDFYYNTTNDLLVESDIPSYLGYTKQMRNIGKTSNRGIELGLSGTIVNGRDFQLNGNFNIGMNRARIDRLDGVDVKPFNSNWAGTDLRSIDDYRLAVGQTIGLIYGFVTDGFYTSDDFASYNPTTKVYTLKDKVPNIGALLGGISVRPGVLKLKDLDGDGNITADKDRQIIGKALPRFSGGFNLTASYKGFDLGAFFNWVYGNDVYNTGKISLNMFYRTTYGNMLNTVNSDNRYKYIDAQGNLVTDLAALAELNKNATIWSPFSFGNAVPVVHSYAIEDGSFLRLNTVTLGYSLPRTLISKIGMSRLRVYATVYNAWLWTKYSGYDPEVSATRSGSYAALTPGVDFSGYPKSRTYTFGVNVSF